SGGSVSADLAARDFADTIVVDLGDCASGAFDARPANGRSAGREVWPTETTQPVPIRAIRSRPFFITTRPQIQWSTFMSQPISRCTSRNAKPLNSRHS